MDSRLQQMLMVPLGLENKQQMNEFGQSKVNLDPQNILYLKDFTINEIQKQALQSALTSMLSIIVGPLQTGKKTMAQTIILNWIQMQTSSILCLPEYHSMLPLIKGCKQLVLIGDFQMLTIPKQPSQIISGLSLINKLVSQGVQPFYLTQCYISEQRYNYLSKIFPSYNDALTNIPQKELAQVKISSISQLEDNIKQMLIINESKAAIKIAICFQSLNRFVDLNIFNFQTVIYGHLNKFIGQTYDMMIFNIDEYISYNYELDLITIYLVLSSFKYGLIIASEDLQQAKLKSIAWAQFINIVEEINA
ncbi:UNKNOWN [Stylonychia lemnae]|uniref:Uncharacterized protein n=1 Tax=Stylonychia lemnae TaxID=5949 RepID=A0A078A250_STYLE|nr:UNKNOWN [Stylonychia lemnae]|eukprot:CDW74829.1 UNKNOWN [Stylonychia lemnae]